MHEGGLDDSRACSETDRRMVNTWHMTMPPDSNANHPKTIYHYTTRAGLQGILQSNTLWASHSQFLNDPAELNYAHGLVTTELQRRIANCNGNQADGTAKTECERHLSIPSHTDQTR